MPEEKNNIREGDFIDLHKMVFDAFSVLNSRQKNVLIKRYGLDSKGVRTLDRIGKEYGITRERVRQIEAESISRVKEIKSEKGLDKVFSLIKKIIEENGGIIGEDFLISVLFKDDSNKKLNRSIISFVLDLDDNLQKSKESKTSSKFYFYENEGVELFQQTIDILEKYFKENNEVLNFDSLIDVLKNSIKEEGESGFSHNSVRSYLSVNKIILKNILGKWGYHKWSHINPKTVKDKSYLALKKEGGPLHFKDITEKINKIWKNKKPTNSQTVHNELIKDERFVLIGRGIYALKEWGYRPGVVLDVIIDTMKKNDGVMDQDSIVDEVMKKRKVKINTIILNLQKKEFFEKLPNKVYRLK